jgi:flagellar biosynthesis GTPase FlhF
MKSKLRIVAIITTFFALQMNAQDRTTVNAMNSEISDNLDLRAVSSIFGESQNLKDFERRLNDPRTKISNLDLNSDNQVDYLRVIESIEQRTHIIIIQSIIGRDLYQDVATIEVEKDRQNNISIQVVGNTYMYGANYIYEPEYHYTPQIYASLWINSYRPYYSSWTWNYYPTYYYAWNPYPLYRYKSNVYGCVNYYNNYNYVNYRRCYRAPAIYNSYSCNSYEKQYPNYKYNRRNVQVSNRYESNQKKYSNNSRPRIEIAYSSNNSDYSRSNTNYNSNSQRKYTQNRMDSSKEFTAQTLEPQRAESQRAESQRDNSPRDYSQNRTNTSRDNNFKKNESTRDTDYASRNSNRRI